MFQLVPDSRDSIVNRSYLFQAQDWQNTRIILITAPSGYGKIVLAHQLVSYLQYPVVWHNLNIWQRDWKVLHTTSVELWSQTLKPNAKLSKFNRIFQNLFTRYASLFKPLNRLLSMCWMIFIYLRTVRWEASGYKNSSINSPQIAILCLADVDFQHCNY
jgi:ATP/maltotriose-dependent transcriptional regulator MalT